MGRPLSCVFLLYSGIKLNYFTVRSTGHDFEKELLFMFFKRMYSSSLIAVNTCQLAKCSETFKSSKRHLNNVVHVQETMRAFGTAFAFC